MMIHDNVQEYCEDLIEKDINSYSDMEIKQKEELTGLILSEILDDQKDRNRIQAWPYEYADEYIVESETFGNVIELFVKYLKSRDTIIGQQVLELMVAGAVKYSKNRINAEIDRVKEFLPLYKEQYEKDETYYSKLDAAKAA